LKLRDTIDALPGLAPLREATLVEEKRP